MNETNTNQGLTNGSSYIEQIIETIQVFFGSMNNVPEDKEDKEENEDKEEKEENEENEENDW
jgi:hypothetical protein